MRTEATGNQAGDTHAALPDAVRLDGTIAFADELSSVEAAGAGCLYGGQFISKCDGPVQPDGVWQRCVGIAGLVPSGFSSH
ncbi:hypothetical protein C6A85_09730, partial [Mycobacterium sp. ITM-2017-0098]